MEVSTSTSPSPGPSLALGGNPPFAIRPPFLLVSLLLDAIHWWHNADEPLAPSCCCLGIFSPSCCGHMGERGFGVPPGPRLSSLIAGLQ